MANTNQTWKGAVQPASTPAGNQYQAWKGAVEPPKTVTTGDGKVIITIG